MKEYHIHINALALSELSQATLRGSGFARRPFIFGTDLDTAYTPLTHYSFKTLSDQELERAFETARIVLSDDRTFVGYAEAEYVSAKEAVGSRPQTLRQYRLPKLQLSPPRRWRESEVHITLPSRSLLLCDLRECNFYVSRIMKNEVEYEVATAQGESRLIDELYDCLIENLHNSREIGLTIKKETLIKIYVSPGFNWLPPQIGGFLLTETGT